MAANLQQQTQEECQRPGDGHGVTSQAQRPGSHRASREVVVGPGAHNSVGSPSPPRHLLQGGPASLLACARPELEEQHREREWPSLLHPRAWQGLWSEASFYSWLSPAAVTLGGGARACPAFPFPGLRAERLAVPV